jgi:hypothetical protein
MIALSIPRKREGAGPFGLKPGEGAGRVIANRASRPKTKRESFCLFILFFIQKPFQTYFKNILNHFEF